MRVRVTLPRPGRYTGDRFGPSTTYAAAHSRVTLFAAPALALDVTLPPREAMQYILTPPALRTGNRGSVGGTACDGEVCQEGFAWAAVV